MKKFKKCPYCDKATFKFYTKIRINFDIEFDENHEPILPYKNIDEITGKDIMNANGDDPLEQQELWCTHCGAYWDAYTKEENNVMKVIINELP